MSEPSPTLARDLPPAQPPQSGAPAPAQAADATAHAAWAFAHGMRTALLATADRDGTPTSSYAPYVHRDLAHYVYVSELAAHSANLRDTGRCSMMFIEDESVAANPFARRRLTLQCAATPIARGSAEFVDTMALFLDRFGPFMNAISDLTDFTLYRLQPSRGTYVAGFARAFTFEADAPEQFHHRRDQGHVRDGEDRRPAPGDAR